MAEPQAIDDKRLIMELHDMGAEDITGRALSRLSTTIAQQVIASILASMEMGTEDEGLEGRKRLHMLKARSQSTATSYAGVGKPIRR
jgi:hypothetical protein